MTWWMRFLSIFLLILLVGCEVSVPQKSLAKMEKNKGEVSLGSVHMRDRTVRLEHSGLFSILTADGQMLAYQLNSVEFQQRFPDLFEEINSAVADIVFVNPCLFDAELH